MWRFWFQDRRSGHAYASAPVYESWEAAIYHAHKKLGEIGLSPKKGQIYTEEQKGGNGKG